MISTVKIEMGKEKTGWGEIRYHMSFQQEKYTRDSQSGAHYDVKLASTVS
jgi:hypothetical protein